MDEAQAISRSAIVRWMKVPDGFPVEQVLPFLADHEKLKAASFRFEPDRQIYCAAHILLRLTIQEAFGPQPYQLHYETSGKPHVFMSDGSPIHVSLSHSKGLAAIALALDCRIGVDIEARGKNLVLEELLPFALSESERMEWMSLARNEQSLDTFLKRWTLKEAIVKAIGQGLGAGLLNFSVTLHPPRLTTPAPDTTSANDWQLCAIAVDDGYLAAAVHVAAHRDFAFDVKQCGASDITELGSSSI